MQVVVNPAPASNLSPTVNAGADKNITLPVNSVDLIGTVTDSDGTITSTVWTKVSGPSASIVSTNTLSTSVTNLVQGIYVFRLTATDNDGATANDDIQVVVNPATSTGATGLNNIVTLAKQWLAASPSERATIEPQLSAWTNNIDQAFALVKPHIFTETAVGEVFYQNFKRPDLRAKYPEQIYHMHIPADYTPSKKKKLVIREHGGGSCDPMSQEAQHLALFDMDNEKVTGRSALRTEIDDSDYILVAAVAPCGSLLPHPGHASRRDVPVIIPYLQDLITDVGERYNIDRDNIVIAGFSMGGIGAGYASLALNDRRAAALISARSWNM